MKTSGDALQIEPNQSVSQAAGRIRLLDILRGFAVLGTLGTNIWIFANHEGINSFLTSDSVPWWNSLEGTIGMLFGILVNGKMLGMLTIMFGIGMEMKYQQAMRRGKAWPGMYIWTALFLIGEGFIHFALVMEYDILMSYGLTALLTALILKRGDRAIKRTMAWMGGLHVVAILALSIVLGVLFMGVTADLDLNLQDTALLYQQGSWLEQVQYRMDNFLALRGEAILILPMNMFLFLLGVRLYRAGLFAMDEEGRHKRKKLMRYGLWIGVPLNALILLPNGVFLLTARYVFAPILALGYIGVIGWVFDRRGKSPLWNRLEQVGKMSLSSYVAQNIVASLIFYGWGLGLGGRVDHLTITFIFFVICLLQLGFAALWLRYFRLGPLESTRVALLRRIQGNR
ncbi:DUF418 domain-containing protein [Paenibacillus daejeonensis]|uniref:DUF418 domain-containing protein n=1 Tax=Paenibacillus daejeonensis TaxID=135193 RepID=UPI000368D135|nr:DUF418 domain-containing protein [Paenibacillus daejeonensis]